MKVLVCCEESQVVCKAFRDKGHDAYSCDLQDCSSGHPEWHIKADVRTLLYKYWDLIIAHPPCTRLANSGVHWLQERNLWNEMNEAIEFFNLFINIAKEKRRKVVIENPIQHKYARQKIEKYHQIIQPYMFGHMEQKATCLWLYGVSPLKETKNVYKEMMELPYKERAKVHWRSPGADRSKLRSKTYPGIAEAMAEQWG